MVFPRVAMDSLLMYSTCPLNYPKIFPLFFPQWGTDKQLLGVSCGGTVQILSEQVMNTHLNDEVGGCQMAPLVEYDKGLGCLAMVARSLQSRCLPRK